MALNDLLRHSGLSAPEITAADYDTSRFLPESGEDDSTGSLEDDVLVEDHWIEDTVDSDMKKR